MIITLNNDTGKMETVAGAGILPKIPVLEPDNTMLLKNIPATDPFFLQSGTVIPVGTTYGTPFVLPWDCFIRIAFNIRNMDIGYGIYKQLPDGTYCNMGGTRPTALGATGPSLTFPPFFLRAGTKIVYGLYNNTGADVTLVADLSQIYFYGVKLATATPNVIDVGTHPGYSLAEMPVIKTLSDGTQEQLQTIDGLKIWQKSYELNTTIGTTITPVILETGFLKRFLGIVTEYSYLRLTTGAVMCIPIHNDGDTVVEIWVRNDNTLCWGAKQGSSGLISGILTIRYAYNP
jgi:hypothetical protein